MIFKNLKPEDLVDATVVLRNGDTEKISHILQTGSKKLIVYETFSGVAVIANTRPGIESKYDIVEVIDKELTVDELNKIHRFFFPRPVSTKTLLIAWTILWILIFILLIPYITN